MDTDTLDQYEKCEMDCGPLWPRDALTDGVCPRCLAENQEK